MLLTFDQTVKTPSTWYYLSDQQCWVRTNSGDGIDIYTDQAAAQGALGRFAAPGTVLYQADWSGGANGWPVANGWKVLDGMYINDGSDGQGRRSDAPYVPGDFGIRDYAVELEIQHIRDVCEGDYGIHVRGTHDKQEYVFDIRGCNGNAAISAWAPNEDRLAINAIKFGTAWHTIHAEVRGNTLTFYLDGSIVASTHDNRLLEGGVVGIASWKSQVEVRSFKVIKL